MSNELIYTKIPQSGLILDLPLDWDAKARVWSDWTATNVSWVDSEKWYTKEVWDFNGTTSYVTFPDTWLPSWSTNRTINMVFNPTSLSATDEYLFDYWTDVAYGRFWITVSTTYIWAVFNSMFIRYTAGLSVWVNYIITVELEWTTANDINIYVNNVLLTTLNSSVNPTNTINTVLSAWRIWQYVWWSLFTDWNIWLVKVYNKVLTASEKQTLYIETQRRLWAWPSYPQLLNWLEKYHDFKWDAYDLVSWTLPTLSWASLTTDHLWRSNNAYTFPWWPTSYMNYWTADNWTGWDCTIAFWINPDTFNSFNVIYYDWSGSFRNIIISPSVTWLLVTRTWNWAWLEDAFTVDYQLTASTWEHIIYSRVWTTKTIYANWIQQATNTWWYTWWVTSQNKVFMSATSLDFGMQWKLSSPMILSKWVTTSEALTLYQLTQKDYIYPFSKSSTLNLQDWLVMSLDWDWNDVSGNGNNWTPTDITQIRKNQTSWWEFNWSTSKIVTTYDLTWPYSISFKVKFNNFSTQRYCYDNDTSATNRYYCYYLQSLDYLAVWSWWTWWLNLTNASTVLWTTDINHITITASSWSNKMYINWVEVISNTTAWTEANVWENLTFWKRITAIEFLDWQLFDQKVRNRVLSAEEVKQDYYLNYIK